MPREFNRSERVAAQIQRELALLLQVGIKNPRLGLLTVSSVELTRDLSLARIYVSAFRPESGYSDAEVIEYLTEAGSGLRQQLAGQMRLRVMPELRFVYDDSIERGMKLSALLNNLKTDSEP